MVKTKFVCPVIKVQNRHGEFWKLARSGKNSKLDFYVFELMVYMDTITSI